MKKGTILFIVMMLATATLMAQQGRIVENPVIDADGFKDWNLTGAGGRNPDGTVYVTGTGTDCTYWLSKPLALEPGGAYVVEFLLKSDKAVSGCCVTGPVCCNVDVSLPGPQWRLYRNLFAVPKSNEPVQLRFGQWHARATIQFANVRVFPVWPIYTKAEGLELGEGESISINEYQFTHLFEDKGRTFVRPLFYSTAGFNTRRWVFGKGSTVIYRFALKGRQQLSGKVATTINYYAGGILKVLASKDNEHWLPVGEVNAMGTLDLALPQELFPADCIYLRLNGEASQKTGAKDSDPGAFQVNLLTYKASLSGTPTEIKGSTRFVQIIEKDDALSVKMEGLGDALPGGENAIALQAKNLLAKPMAFAPVVSLRQENGEPHLYKGKPVTIKPGETQFIQIPYEVPDTGNWVLEAKLGGDSSYAISTELNVPDFFSINYGEMLASGETSLWWASSGWKISPTRRLPTVKGKALALSAARNEAEAAQLVISPNRNLEGVKVSVSDLKCGWFGATISSAQVDILKVYYHQIAFKTDATGILGLWPDALPPIPTEGLRIAAKTNQPIWIRVNVPADAKSGLYKGEITVSDSTGWKATVPMQVEVYGFTMPDVSSCETAFGFNLRNAAKYHKATTKEQRHLLWEKYMAELSRHHLSIYDPGQLAPFKASVKGSKARWSNCQFLYDTPKPGDYAITIKDDSKTQNISSDFDTNLPLSGESLLIEFQYRLDQPGEAMLTLGSFDADNQWMRGCNKDFVLKGDANWQSKTIEVKEFKPEAKSIKVTLRATRWVTNGEKIGTLTVANFTLKEKASGKLLIAPDSMRRSKLEELKLAFDWEEWDGYVEEAFRKYHANTLRIPVGGLGGGTFHARVNPTLLGFAEGTPEYDALMPKYFGEIQRHLKEKGWLDKCYVYWFDEPDPKDYEFVMNGFRKLKNFAPEIRRMLTEQVEPDLIGGPNLWCPGSAHTLREDVESRHAAGEQFWWYVCTGPKAPYPTLFIDHPGTEMRVWLWQTWDLQIDGVLIWATNHWTSPAAYPNSLQNPYLDPMSWVSGYDTPAGTRRPWGNGDGRFVYPPEACADGTQEGFVEDAPVGCIRLEMLRDGIEDYEYFAMLRKRLAERGGKLSPAKRAAYEALLKVPAEVTSSQTTFTASPAPIEAHRDKLAKAIAELQ